MPDFDPYHRWLGIPSDEQPAGFRRLLGISEDENDPQVVREAALRQTAFVRKFSIGEHGEQAERILGEIADARDSILSGKSESATKPAVKPSPTSVDTIVTPIVNVTPPVDRETPKADPTPRVDPLKLKTNERTAISSKPLTRSGSRSGKPVWQQPWATAAGGAIAVLLIMMLFGAREETKELAKTNDSQAQQQIAELKQKLAAAEMSVSRQDDSLVKENEELGIQNEELGIQIKKLTHQNADLKEKLSELAIASKARPIGKTISPLIPAEAVSFQGHRYHLIENKVPWHQAEMDAAAMGGYLIRLESTAEHDFVISWLKQLNCGSHVHIDGTRFLDGETFLFSDNREMPLDLLHKGNIKGLPQKNWEQFLFLAAGNFHIDSWHFHQCFYIVEWSVDQIPNNLNRKADISSSLEEGLVAYYPFNGNANDESGNNNHGQVQGATLVSDRKTIPQRAFGFDGQSYIKVSDKQYLSGFDSMTVGLWANYTSPVEPNSTALLGLVTKWGQDTSNDTFAVWLSPNGRFHAGSSLRTQTALAVSGPLKIEQWQHLVYTHDIDSGDNVYVNGTLVDSDITAGGRIQVSQNPLYIGADNRDGKVWRHFNGAIDEVRIYNRALSAAEVKALYEFEKP